MYSRFLVLGLLLLIPLTGFGGTTGKIQGVVKDKDTGDALPGANVVIEGTTLGAATGLDGGYFLLNVPVGVYDISARMMGYQTVLIKNVRVSIDLTTRVDFELSTEVLQFGDVTVVAERPLINKEVTASMHISSAEEFKNLPVSNTKDVVELTAGVDGSNFRGGLDNEVTYMVDGVSINDPMFHKASTQINLNAVQEIQVNTGAYNAEYGEAMSGIVNIVTKEGGNKTEAVYEITTDTFADEVFGKKYDFGYFKNEFSVGGPLPFTDGRVRYFLAGNTMTTNVYKPRMYSFTDYSFENPYPNGVHREFYVPHSGRQEYGTNLKVSWQLNSNLKLRISGFQNREKYERELYEGTSQTSERSYLFKQDDFDVTMTKSHQIQINVTHQINSSTFYDARIVHFYTRTQTGLQRNLDDGFFEDYKFRDLTEHAPQDWTNPENPFGVFNMFQSREATGRIYERRKEFYTGIKFDGVSQIQQNHQLKLGVEGYTHDVSRYRNTLPWDPEPFLQQYHFYPWTAAGYLQDSMEYPGFIVNLGVRFDAFYAYAEKRVDPFDWYSVTQNVSVKYKVSPRVGISHPISDRTVLRFFYGKFFQTPSFELLFKNLDPYVTRSYSGVGNPDLRAMTTLSYELGIEHQITQDMAADFTVYYKDQFDLMGTTPILAVPFNYSHDDNVKFANVRGFEVTVNKRLENYVQGKIAYSLWRKDNRHEPSFSEIAQGEINPRTGDLYEKPYQLIGTFHHRFSSQIDIVFPDEFGPTVFGIHPFQNMYADFITTIRSGDYYTPKDDKGEPIADYFSAQKPWRSRTDMEINKDFKLFGRRVSVFAQVINLFGEINILNVFAKTQDPVDDGKIINESNFSDGISRYQADGTENPRWTWEQVKDLDGNEKISQHEEFLAFQAAYKYRVTQPDHFGLARQYRMGVRFNF